MCAADLINPSRWRTMCLSGNSKCAAITATMSRKRKVMGTQGWLWPHHRPSTIFAMGPGYCNKYALSIVLCCSCTWRMCGVCYVLPLSMCTRCIVAPVRVAGVHVAVCQWSWWRSREARSRCQKLVLFLLLVLAMVL